MNYRMKREVKMTWGPLFMKTAVFLASSAQPLRVCIAARRAAASALKLVCLYVDIRMCTVNSSASFVEPSVNTYPNV